MAGGAAVTFEGNLAGDPEARKAGDGTVTSFTVVVNERKREGGEWVDGDPTFWRCSAWAKLGENVLASVHKGDRVIVTGTASSRKWKTKEGEDRESIDVNADAVAVSLRFASVQITRTGPSGGGARGGRPQPRQQAPQQDRWATTYDDDQPF